MSEPGIECRVFDRWILEESVSDGDRQSWQSHLKNCTVCQAQWVSHQVLLAVFEDEPLPELSPEFNSRLEARLKTALEVRPLSGWRLAAIMSYATAALAALAWLLRDSPLASIDLTSPGIALVALALVPVTQAVAVWSSRLLPDRQLNGSAGSGTSLLLSL